jgi:hypothetical protein
MTQFVTIQRRRQEYLEWLYKESGRDDPSHPDHCLYTGLVQLRAAELMDYDQRIALGDIK